MKKKLRFWAFQVITKTLNKNSKKCWAKEKYKQKRWKNIEILKTIKNKKFGALSSLFWCTKSSTDPFECVTVPEKNYTNLGWNFLEVPIWPGISDLNTKCWISMKYHLNILDFDKKSPTSTGRISAATDPFANFLVPIVSSSIWKAQKWYLCCPGIRSTPSPEGKREAKFRKKSRLDHQADVHHPTSGTTLRVCRINLDHILGRKINKNQ